MIKRDASLRDVALEVSTALHNAGLRVVLVGGSAATFYAPHAYQSQDLDFIARFAVDDERKHKVVKVLATLGYELEGNTFVHKQGNPFTIEFPMGPASIGDEVLQHFDTVREGNRMLVIVTPTDCIRDRLAHFFYWNDRTAFSAAIGIAQAQKLSIQLEHIRAWAAKLAAESMVEYPDIPIKARQFFEALRSTD